MAAAENGVVSGSDAPPAAVPHQRTTPEQDRIAADDRLIEAIRLGEIHEDSPVEPVARMLAAWRSQVLAEV